MLLAVNIGNSNIRFGVFKPDGEIKSWTINTKPYRTEDECYAKFKGMYPAFDLKKTDITAIVIASVVPPLTMPVFYSLKRIHKIEPLIVNRDSVSSVCHTSHQMGADIFSNAVAAQTLYKGNKLVIDFGTAMTFCAINQTGKIIGVAIAPGVETALNSLVSQTAQLPEIDLVPPKNILGMDTESCMQSGMVYGFLSMVEGMIDRINSELKTKCFVIATGGLSAVFSALTTKIDKQDVLHTLKGVAELYKMNKTQ